MDTTLGSLLFAYALYSAHGAYCSIRTASLLRRLSAYIEHPLLKKPAKEHNLTKDSFEKDIKRLNSVRGIFTMMHIWPKYFLTMVRLGLVLNTIEETSK